MVYVATKARDFCSPHRNRAHASPPLHPTSWQCHLKPNRVWRRMRTGTTDRQQDPLKCDQHMPVGYHSLATAGERHPTVGCVCGFWGTLMYEVSHILGGTSNIVLATTKHPTKSFFPAWFAFSLGVDGHSINTLASSRVHGAALTADPVQETK